jgi:hypothetical protein
MASPRPLHDLDNKPDHTHQDAQIQKSKEAGENSVILKVLTIHGQVLSCVTAIVQFSCRTMSANLRSLVVSLRNTRSRSKRAAGSGIARGVAIWRAARSAGPTGRDAFLEATGFQVCPVFDLGGHVTFYERTEVLPGRRTVDALSHLKWGILSSSMPNRFGPGIRRSVVD